MDGDKITLDLENRRIDLDVPEQEIARRVEDYCCNDERYHRGYTKLFIDHVTQADKGCDFDFLEGTEVTPEPEIY